METLDLSDIQIGDFIEVTYPGNYKNWKRAGMVMDIKPMVQGEPGAIEVMLQEYPDQPSRNWKCIGLESMEGVEVA